MPTLDLWCLAEGTRRRRCECCVRCATPECLVPREDLAWYYRTYADGRCDYRDPRVSPLFAPDLSGLPPALIIAAEYDALRDEAKAYAEPLQLAGVATRYRCAESMVHGYLQMRGLVAAADHAARSIARAVN